MRSRCDRGRHKAPCQPGYFYRRRWTTSSPLKIVYRQVLQDPIGQSDGFDIESPPYQRGSWRLGWKNSPQSLRPVAGNLFKTIVDRRKFSTGGDEVNSLHGRR
jgi:hypothetical protein